MDSLAGHSGAVRVALLTRDEVEQIPSLIKKFGSDVTLPGVRTLTLPQNKTDFAFVTLKPWAEKNGAYVNTYHVGSWPGERRNMSDKYDNPVGFIEVTPDNLDLRLSLNSSAVPQGSYVIRVEGYARGGRTERFGEAALQVLGQ